MTALLGLTQAGLIKIFSASCDGTASCCTWRRMSVVLSKQMIMRLKSNRQSVVRAFIAA